jgi:hypothetical protein
MTVSLNTNPTQNTETIPNANPKANLHTVIDHSNKDQKIETSMSRRRLISQVKWTNISMSCCYLQQFTRKTHQILVACVGEGTGLYVRPKSNTKEKFYDITSIKFLTQDHLQKQLEHHNCSSIIHQRLALNESAQFLAGS